MTARPPAPPAAGPAAGPATARTPDATGPALRRPPRVGAPRPAAADGCPGQLALDLSPAGTGRWGPPGAGPGGPPTPTGTGGPPDPARWAEQFVQAALEVAQGRRPPGQLTRWADPPVLRVLQRRHRLAVPGVPAPPRVRVLRAEPVAGDIEVAAVAYERRRVRAVALRLVRTGDRWRVTALELG